MTKEEKLRCVNELLRTAASWKMYERSVVSNFIDEAQFKIEKIEGPQSPYIKDIDIFTNGKGNGGWTIDDWQEQILTVLKKWKFEIENQKEEMAETNKTLIIHCNKCNHNTTHIVYVEKREREISKEPYQLQILEFWLDKHVQVLKCGSCGELALRKYDIWCEDAPDFPETNIEIYPKRGNPNIKPADSFVNVPEQIILLYKQIVEAYINQIPLLCAGGIRAILEAICIDKGIREGTVNNTSTASLKGKIYGLSEHGLTTSKHSEILVHHQYLGDKALHELEVPSSDELLIAIQIIAHTISSVYELEHKGEELKSKKQQRNA